MTIGLSVNAVISIVDDDEEYREALAVLMKSLRFRATTFSSAAEFLASPHLARTSCLIADVNMPGTTGVELHGHLVRSGHAIPTILITAYPDEAARTRALEQGVIAYLSKPCNEGVLFELVVSALTPSNKTGRNGP